MVDFAKLVKEKPIRDEIAALIKRGNVTLAEHNALRCNSWEFEALIPALTIEALIAKTEHAIKNCPYAESPAVTYTEAVHSVYAPELIKRLRAACSYPCACGEHGTDTPCPHTKPQHIHGCNHPREICVCGKQNGKYVTTGCEICREVCLCNMNVG